MKERKLSMAVLAQMAGVSKNTVSLALRNDPQISLAVKRRIHRLAQKTGYEKNPVVGELMARLRTGATTGYKATFAVLNANQDAEAFRNHPTIPVYVEGCRRRARQQGYGLDEFWLGDPQLDGSKLSRIFVSRGIRGALVIGMMDRNQLPARFDKIWQEYACVVTGVRTHEPALSFACADHHDLTLQAVEHALSLGYRRPALVLDTRIDRLIDGRMSAGMQIGQRQLPPGGRVPTFYTLSATDEEARFRTWFAKSRPDVILTLYHTVSAWLTRLGTRVPEDTGLIQLEWRRDHAHWAGMDQHNDLVGEAAVDMLVSMVHNGEFGVPAARRATLIGSSWVDGRTVRQVAKTA